MTKMLFLLLAALLPAATWAQTGTQAGQGAQTGKSFCGHVMDAGTFVDARARNASGDEAFVIRWLGLKSNVIHSALLNGRCVAKDGDTIDSKVIVRVLPNSLAVSNQHGRVGWEAEFRYMYGPLGNGPSRRGLFDQDRFVAELDESKAAEPGSASGEPDFRWNQELETLTLKPGVVLVAPTPNYTYAAAPPSNSAQPSSAPSAPAQAPAPAAKPNCTPQQGPSVKAHIPKKPSAWACKTLGICAADDKPVDLNPPAGCPSAPAGGQPAK